MLAMLDKKPPHVVSGTAIYLTSQPQFVPTALMHNLKHNKMLHENNLIITVVTRDIPRVSEHDRMVIEPLSRRFTRATLCYGFMETPNVTRALGMARKLGLQFDIMSTSFLLSRRALKPARTSRMPRWQDRMFLAMTRSANDATDYFQIPTDRVVEIGTQLTI
jgi:KUP system potassium uptake protein